MENNQFRILILPEGKSEMKEFGVSKSKLFFLLGSFLTVILVIVIISVSLISRFVFGRNLVNLKKEKIALNEQLLELKSHTKELEKKIEELNKRDDELRLFAGIPRLDKEIKDVGVGGAPSDYVESNSFFRKEEDLAYKIGEKIDEFERKIILQNKSFNDIYVKLNEQKEFTKYFPAIRPVVGGRTSDRFGYRPDPFTKKREFHKGVDISIEKGSPVYATADGIVEYTGWNGSFGKFILIDHNSSKYGFKTGYGHLSKILVKKGQRVKRGDIIGKVGNTGRSTAPHLHLSLIHI